MPIAGLRMGTVFSFSGHIPLLFRKTCSQMFSWCRFLLVFTDIIRSVVESKI